MINYAQIFQEKGVSIATECVNSRKVKSKTQLKKIYAAVHISSIISRQVKDAKLL